MATADPLPRLLCAVICPVVSWWLPGVVSAQGLGVAVSGSARSMGARGTARFWQQTGGAAQQEALHRSYGKVRDEKLAVQHLAVKWRYMQLHSNRHGTQYLRPRVTCMLYMGLCASEHVALCARVHVRLDAALL